MFAGKKPGTCPPLQSKYYFFILDEWISRSNKYCPTAGEEFITKKSFLFKEVLTSVDTTVHFWKIEIKSKKKIKLCALNDTITSICIICIICCNMYSWCLIPRYPFLVYNIEEKNKFVVCVPSYVVHAICYPVELTFWCFK